MIISDSETKTIEKGEKFAVVYFSDTGFKIFAANIYDKKLLTNLEYYPTLLGIMQNQSPSGLTSAKINSDMFLFTYILEVRNLNAKDRRLQKRTLTIVNFLTSRATYQRIMFYFDDFENFLKDYFYPITFLDDLYAIDFSDIVPRFLNFSQQQGFSQLNSSRTPQTLSFPQRNKTFSLTVEFNKWLARVCEKEDK
ncbi:MAG: hypothetical protein ACTSQE_01660 [Candidatus Heimdallarchaeaceae archaeon]